MKTIYPLLWAAIALPVFGQSQLTPNLQFNTPYVNAPNWSNLLNANFGKLDLILSGNQGVPSSLFSTLASPATPASGVRLYLNTDGLLHVRDINGNDYALTAGAYLNSPTNPMGTQCTVGTSPALSYHGTPYTCQGSLGPNAGTYQNTPAGPAAGTGDWTGLSNANVVHSIQGVTVTPPASGLLVGRTDTQVITNKDLTTGNTFPVLNQNTTGKAATADALTNAPTPCTGTQKPTGVDVNGNSIGCSATTGTPGGSPGQIQINSAGTFGGVAAPSSAIVGITDAQTLTTKKVSDSYTVGVSGVTANLLAARDSNLNSRAILPTAGGCGFGIAQATVAAGASVIVQYGGIATLVADNAVAAGDLIGGGTVTPGRGADLFQQSAASVPAGVCVVGRAQTSAAAGSTFTVLLSNQGTVGTSASALAPVIVPNTIPVNTSGTSTRPAASSDIANLFSCSSGFLDSTGFCSFPTKLTSQKAITPGTILDGNIVTLGTTITVSGAVSGNLATVVSVSPALPAGTKATASVSAANTVSIIIENQTGGPITPAATTFTVMVDTAPASIWAHDFGAVADGVTDAVPALTAAINVACVTGGTVYLDSGTYFLNSFSLFPGIGSSYHNLPLCSGLNLVGQALGQTTLLQGPLGVNPGTGAAFVLGPPTTGANTWQDTSGPGAANGPWYTLNSVTLGDTCEIATTASDASNFPVGSYAYLANFWTNANANYIQSQPEIITSFNATTGKICFNVPIARTFTPGVFSATYVSGGTTSGTGTCNVGSFTGGGANSELAVGTIAVSGGAFGAITMVQGGYSFSSPATGATVTSGTATCSGNIVITSVLASAFIRNVTPTTTHNVSLRNLTVQGVNPISISEMWWINGKNVDLVMDTTNGTSPPVSIFIYAMAGGNFDNMNIRCVGSTADCNTSIRTRYMQLFSRNGSYSNWSNSTFTLGGLLLGSENVTNLSFINDTMNMSAQGINAQGANVQVIGGTVNCGGVSGVTYNSAFTCLTDTGGNIPGDWTTISGVTVNSNMNSGGYSVQIGRAKSSLVNSMINVLSPATFCGVVQSASFDNLLANQKVTGNTCTTGDNGWQSGGAVGSILSFDFSNNTTIGTGATGMVISPSGLMSSSSVPKFTNNVYSGFTTRYSTNANVLGAAITSPATDVIANLNRYSAPVILTNITLGSNPCVAGPSTGLATPSGSPGSLVWDCR